MKKYSVTDSAGNKHVVIADEMVLNKDIGCVAFYLKTKHTGKIVVESQHVLVATFFNPAAIFETAK